MIIEFLMENGNYVRREMSTTQVAGLPWEDIAASAYRAYSASTGNKNFRGDPMPQWNDLPQPIQVAWEAAVRQVGYCVWSPDRVIPDEKQWAGWLPPRFKLESV